MYIKTLNNKNSDITIININNHTWLNIKLIDFNN